MWTFRLALVLGWLLMVGVTIHAIASLGLSDGRVFFTDFQHPWRAQVNADFCVHLALVMGWIVCRERTWQRGLLLALPALLGSVYLLPYLCIATLRSGGRLDELLLGQHGSAVTT
jgi:hypothetical protein